VERAVSFELLSRLIWDAVDRGVLQVPPPSPLVIPVWGSCTAPVLVDLVAQQPGPDFVWNRPSIGTLSYREWRAVGNTAKWRVPRKRLDVRVYRGRITKPFFASLQVPCRKCDDCMAARKKRWQARACAEFDNSARTWFLTLTLRPEARFYAQLQGGYKKFLNQEFTKMLKRLREKIALPFRYLSVLEEHKDGVLHLHALVHDGRGLIPKAAIRSEWRHGITHCRLASKDDCFYIAKYLMKGTQGRVRASKNYGVPLGDSQLIDVNK